MDRHRLLGLGVQVARQLLSLAVAALFVVPLLWVLAAALRQPGLPPPRTIEWLPSPVAWENFRRSFELVPLGAYLRNSLIIVAAAVPLTLLTASWAGFAIAQLPAHVRRRLVVLAILLLMVPGSALWLARSMLFAQLGLIDTRWALLAPALMGSSPFFVLLFYWSFRGIPQETFDAAQLDGAGPLETWRLVALPLARPATTVVAVLSFALYWGDFMSPLLFLKSEQLYTLPLGLRALQQLDRGNWPLLMAASAVMVAPVALAFLVVRRHFWPER